MKNLILIGLVLSATVGMAHGQQGNVEQQAAPSLGAPTQVVQQAPTSGATAKSVAAPQLGDPVQYDPAVPSNAAGEHKAAAPALVPTRSSAEEEDAKDAK
jgi:hypothetical protein